MVQLTGNYNQPDFNTYKPSKKSWLFVVILISVLAIIGFAVGSSSKEIKVSGRSEPFWHRVASIFTFEDAKEDPDYLMPEEEKNRLDILILGIRGKDDPEAETSGALLTDTIMVFSFDKASKSTSLVSIPRDLYIKTGKNKVGKINTAYENLGLKSTKELVSKITGIFVDKAVVLDFSSFEKIINAVDGIDITLSKPFEEPEQWGYGFILPAGENHLDGKTALYYSRSRFSTNDFDRSRRQQELIFALKDKLSKHSWWTDPIKTFEILTAVSSGIKTDFNILNTKEIIDLTKEVNSAGNIKSYVISTENLLYESRIGEAYVLLPTGDNLTQIKKLFQNIINQND